MRFDILFLRRILDDFYELMGYWFLEKQLRHEYSRGNLRYTSKIRIVFTVTLPFRNVSIGLRISYDMFFILSKI